MMKRARQLIVLTAALFAVPAYAILLDCKDNGDGTYSCVEISTAADSPAVPAAKNQAHGVDPAFVEQAKKECTFRTPRRRAVGGMSSNPAIRSEAMKSAKAEYERCVAEKADALRKASQNSIGP